MLWEQEVPGSNPGVPTDVTICYRWSYAIPLHEILERGLYVCLYVRDEIGAF